MQLQHFPCQTNSLKPSKIMYINFHCKRVFPRTIMQIFCQTETENHTLMNIWCGCCSSINNNTHFWIVQWHSIKHSLSDTIWSLNSFNYNKALMWGQFKWILNLIQLYKIEMRIWNFLYLLMLMYIYRDEDMELLISSHVDVYIITLIIC